LPNRPTCWRSTRPSKRPAPASRAGVCRGGDEVRQLASRTSQATEEIVGVVRQNQEMARNAVALMTDGKLQAEQGLALAAEGAR
jgi:hypothetical protein